MKSMPLTFVWRFKALTTAAAGCLVVTLATAPRPPGIDNNVWTLAYVLIAIATVAVGWFPSLLTFRIWGALGIGIHVIRAFYTGLNPPIPQVRVASVASNLFIAILCYWVWDGWRHTVPSFNAPHPVEVVAVRPEVLKEEEEPADWRVPGFIQSTIQESPPAP